VKEDLSYKNLRKTITQAYGCRRLVIASPNTASSETAAYAMQVVTEGPVVRVFSVGVNNSKLALHPLKLKILINDGME